jgi:hypothetical protein
MFTFVAAMLEISYRIFQHSSSQEELPLRFLELGESPRKTEILTRIEFWLSIIP